MNPALQPFAVRSGFPAGMSLEVERAREKFAKYGICGDIPIRVIDDELTQASAEVLRLIYSGDRLGTFNRLAATAALCQVLAEALGLIDP